MGDRKFYLYKRKNGTYYAELLSQDGTRVLYRSTGSKNRDNALLTVAGWLKDGTPTKGRTTPLKEAANFQSVLKFLKTGDIDGEQALELAQVLKGRGLLSIGISPASHIGFVSFLRDFWNYETSFYLKDKIAHGGHITKRTCRQAQNMIEKDWAAYFQNKTLSEVTRKDLRQFGLSLQKRIAGKTINNVLSIGTRALKWAYFEKMIPENIVEGLGGFVGGETKRDIFSTEETEILFNEKHWNDKMAYAAALLAETSGLRNGEIRALRGADIGDKLYSVKTENGNIQDVYMLYVRHGWNHLDGLKDTKNHEAGTVHLLPQVREKLFALLEQNPHDIKSEEKFIFWGTKPDRPCGAQRLLNGLRYAIEQAGIDIAGRKIDLHSFRHENGTSLLKKTKDIKKVAKSLRHKSIKMTERYTDHATTDEMENEVASTGAIAAEVFANILSFPTSKAI